MQREMESVTSSAVSRNFFDIASAADAAALVDRTIQVTLWRVTEPRDAQMQDALALHEVCVMRASIALSCCARTRREIFDGGRTRRASQWAMRKVFWDGISDAGPDRARDRVTGVRCGHTYIDW